MSLGVSYGQTQAQRDAFLDYARKIEQSVMQPDRLGGLQDEIDPADLAPEDREQLLGRIEQYRLDLTNAAGELDNQEGDDGRAGGSAV